METTTHPDIADITRGIINGSYDGYLDFLIQTATSRQSVNRRSSLSLGTKVKVSGDVRPKYMIGTIGTIERINRTTVVVRFDPDTPRYADKAVRVPIDCVIPV